MNAPTGLRLTNADPELAALLFLPITAEPSSVARPAVIICPGLGSRKERHEDFCVRLASNGFLAFALDLRGHGESAGRLDGREHLDILAAVDWLRVRQDVDSRRIAVRGSSFGGMVAIRAAAESESVSAVVAICPAHEDLLLESLGKAPVSSQICSDGLYARLAMPDMLDNLGRQDIRQAVARLQPRPLLLVHAKGDESIPYQRSEELFALAGEPKQLWLLEGGSHTSAQHDIVVQNAVIDWLRLALGDGSRCTNRA